MDKGSTRRVRLNAWLGVTPQDDARNGVADSELGFTTGTPAKKGVPEIRLPRSVDIA
jgi:hypothetical protein